MTDQTPQTAPAWDAVSTMHQWASEGGRGQDNNLRRCPVCHAVVPLAYTSDHLDWHLATDRG